MKNSASMSRFVTFAAAVCGSVLLLGPSVRADDAAAIQKLSKEEIATRFVGITAADVREGGRLLIQGEIIDITSKRNLTEARRAEVRAALIASVDPAKEIVFTP